MIGVTIRQATAEDLAGILEIYNEAALNSTATYDYEPRTIEYRRMWLEEHQQHGLPVFVAVDPEGRVVGWSALSHYDHGIGFRFTAESAIYVAADQRGRGIGKLLVPPLLEAARARGLHAIVAKIDADNEASVHLHAAFGYTQAGHLKQIGFKFGRWVDVVYMERLL
jgi:phosphinothricin acetyltransferase